MPGIVASYIHRNQVGALVELNCENKVTAMTPEFQTLGREIAMQVAACPKVKYVRVEDIPDRIVLKIRRKLARQTTEVEALQQYLESICLYDRLYIRDDSMMVEDLIKLHMTQLAENISVTRFSRFEIQDSDDLNPPSDPGIGVPSNPLPNSPNQGFGAIEDIWDDDLKPNPSIQIILNKSQE